MTKGHETKPKISFGLISHLARASCRRGEGESQEEEEGGGEVQKSGMSLPCNHG